MKKFASILLAAVALVFSVGASAQTIKGVNQNGMQESIPHEAIARYKHDPATGVLQYEHRWNGTIYQITDPGANEAAELYVHFGSANRAVTPDGWTIHRGRVGVLCQIGGGQPYTMLKVYGHNGTHSYFDNCAFANQMYQQ